MRIQSLALILILSLLTSCSPNASDGPPKLNVLIIAIDTLRADRMSLYGYDRPTTPEIDAFATTATTYDRAITPSSWTRASFASYFTGLYPATHGCVNRDGQMSEGLHTLAERFREAGWGTASFYANANIAAEFGFGQGFDIYDSPPVNARYPRGIGMIDAISMNERIFSWLHNERPEDKPWFMFTLYVDPHDPYLPHEEYQFGEDQPTKYLNGSRRVLRAMDKGETKKNVEQIKRINRNLYDGEVAFVDHHVGALLDELETLGLSDDTVVILLSDHGEGLWDHHNYRSHGEQVYQEQIHVPLIMRWPGRTTPGSRVEYEVGVMDVFGTLADGFDLAAPEEHQSKSLFQTTEGRPLYVDERVGRLHKRAVIDWPWKLILNRMSPTELYNLADDPGERTSLVDLEPAVLARLTAMADSIKTQHETMKSQLNLKFNPLQIDEKTKQQIEALGYVN
jgi:arylsulfatase A-like enzyme